MIQLVVPIVQEIKLNVQHATAPTINLEQHALHVMLAVIMWFHVLVIPPLKLISLNALMERTSLQEKDVLLRMAQLINA